MRPLLLASLLLLAVGVFAQDLPGTSGDGSSPDQHIISRGSSDTCLAMRVTHVPRTERLMQDMIGRRTTTCTPANRFRTEYIPNALFHPDVKQASTPEPQVKPSQSWPRPTQ